MQESTYGFRASGYVRHLRRNLSMLDEYINYFDEVTPEEWQECIKDFDDILSIIQKLDKLQDKCYERFVEKLGNVHE